MLIYIASREAITVKRAQIQQFSSFRSTKGRQASYLLIMCFILGGELESVRVFGRLGDLGEIDSKYDVAVSTASSALDYIVVQTAEDAQHCIEYLKKYRCGRARFLVLDEMK